MLAQYLDFNINVSNLVVLYWYRSQAKVSFQICAVFSCTLGSCRANEILNVIFVMVVVDVSVE